MGWKVAKQQSRFSAQPTVLVLANALCVKLVAKMNVQLWL